MALSFAYDVPPGKEDHLVEAAEFTTKLFAELAVPGRTMVNVLPFLKYIPPWVPGAVTQRQGARAKQMVMQYKAETFESVERDLVTFAPAMIAHRISNNGSILCRPPAGQGNVYWRICCNAVLNRTSVYTTTIR